MPTTPRVDASLVMILVAALFGCEGQVSGGSDEGGHEEPPAPEILVHELPCTLRVVDTSNLAREAQPVSGGIPFARGTLLPGDLARVVLLDRAGELVPSFQEPIILAKWNDGSVKWLLVDFLANVPAGETLEVRLALAETAVVRSPGIVVTTANASFSVDTGRIKAVLSRTRFGLLDEVWVDRNGDGAYTADERVVTAPGEMFVDLDDAPPGLPDSGAYEYPSAWYFGMEGGNWMRDSQAATSTRYLASQGDYAISLFRQGATHSVFKIEGWYREAAGTRQFGKYTLYLHFYAGQDFVRLSHTWIMTGDPEKNFVRRMAIELPFSGTGDLNFALGGAWESAGESVTLTAGEAPFVPVVPGPSAVVSGTVPASGQIALVSVGPEKYYHNLTPDDDTSVGYSVLKDGLEISTGLGAAGWATVAGGGLGIAAGIRDFWREHPKEVRFDDGRMQVFLWPDHGGKTLDLRRRYPEVRGPASEAGASARREFAPPGSAVGMAKTTDVYLRFYGGEVDATGVDRTFRSVQDPLRPWATGTWNVGSGVLGPVHSYDMAARAQQENHVNIGLAWPMRGAEEFGWHGWLDYGDQLLEYESLDWELDVPNNAGVYANWGYSGWGQEAYRIGPTMLIQYLRSGLPLYLRAADAWVGHHRDVDCVHWNTPDDGTLPGDDPGGMRIGGGHRHDQQHWGAYLAGYGIPTIATTLHYFITGEGRDLDALRLFSEWILAGGHIENHGLYSVLYMAEALDDATLVARVLERDQDLSPSFGRIEFDSGMGLMLYDVQTAGGMRSKIRSWAAALDNEGVAFLRGYLQSVEPERTSYLAQINADFAYLFPENSVRTGYFAWADRLPINYRDALSPEFMPRGPHEWPLRMIEHVVFDGPYGLGNNPTRQVFTAQILWLMPHVSP